MVVTLTDVAWRFRENTDPEQGAKLAHKEASRFLATGEAALTEYMQLVLEAREKGIEVVISPTIWGRAQLLKLLAERK